MPERVTIVGAGEIGCGWAALCASAGWPVTLFDTNARMLERASTEVPRRARALIALERATAGIVERGLQELSQGRSLLLAVQDAEWVIEAIPEDLLAKQKLFEAVDQIAKPETLLTSSSSGMLPKDIFARCRRQDRCLVTHPLNPPEFIPLVEVVPAERTGPAWVTRAYDYLSALGRVPIVIRKPVPGYVVGRIAAAVWRECVDLVLTGVIGVEELDRAVSLGPALGWAAAGPHLTYHLAAGKGGVTVFLQRLLASFEQRWGELATWHNLEPEQLRMLTHAIERAYEGKLSSMLRALEQARTDP